MPLLSPASTLLLVDVQARLFPAVNDRPAILANLLRLTHAARLLRIPMLATEHNPEKIGRTIDELADLVERRFTKMHFDACREPGFLDCITTPDIVVAGTESHVCVLQTALGLRGHGRQVTVVADAVGSRTEANRTAGLARLARNAVEIATTEMVLFEWLESCEHPRFREVLSLIR
jgi:nicotinamidase-related amidase